jgi:hypothetical protein
LDCNNGSADSKSVNNIDQQFLSCMANARPVKPTPAPNSKIQSRRLESSSSAVTLEFWSKRFNATREHCSGAVTNVWFVPYFFANEGSEMEDDVETTGDDNDGSR